jgi:hypothetical protein
MRRTSKYAAITKDEGNAVDGPFSATYLGKHLAFRFREIKIKRLRGQGEKDAWEKCRDEMDRLRKEKPEY